MSENSIEDQIQIEDSIIGLLSSIWKMYDKLSELHPMDKAMFHESLHKAQAIILARPKMRGILMARSGQVPQPEPEEVVESRPSKIPLAPGQKAAIVTRGTSALPPLVSPVGQVK